MVLVNNKCLILAVMAFFSVGVHSAPADLNLRGGSDQETLTDTDVDVANDEALLFDQGEEEDFGDEDFLQEEFYDDLFDHEGNETDHYENYNDLLTNETALADSPRGRLLRELWFPLYTSEPYYSDQLESRCKAVYAGNVYYADLKITMAGSRHNKYISEVEAVFLDVESKHKVRKASVYVRADKVWINPRTGRRRVTRNADMQHNFPDLAYYVARRDSSNRRGTKYQFQYTSRGCRIVGARRGEKCLKGIRLFHSTHIYINGRRGPLKARCPPVHFVNPDDGEAAGVEVRPWSNLVENQ